METKRATSWSVLLLAFGVHFGCHADGAEVPQAAPTTSVEPDPYFIESTAVTRSSGPASITRAVFQDRTGRMWLASWEGIISYDGATFTNHTNRDGLRRYRAFTILEDRAGDLWFGTVGAGVYRYDGATFAHLTSNDGLAYDRVGCLTEDSKGTIWIGTERGISCYANHSFRNFTAQDGLVDGDVNSIVEARDGAIWIATRGNSYVWDGTRFTPLTTPDGRTFENVRSILEDDAGRIWLGGSDGLWRTDGRTYTRISPRFTGYLYKARDGRIWVSAQRSGESRGMSLFVVNPDADALFRDPLESVIELAGQVFGIEEDVDGNIWFGTERGVQRYDGTSFQTFEGWAKRSTGAPLSVRLSRGPARRSLQGTSSTTRR